jgi:hypothetical protein
MMKTPLRLSVHPPGSSRSSLPSSRAGEPALSAAADGILAGVSFDPLAEHNLYTVGALAEALNVLTLLFMFWVVQCAQITLKTYLPHRRADPLARLRRHRSDG